MAGTLTISTLSDGTNRTSATNCIQGSAKAWVNFNGVSGASIRASYNVSSVTYNSTGKYTVNFTNALADANYAVVIYNNGSVNTAQDSFDNNYIGGAGARTTTSVGVASYSATFADSALFDVVVFR